MPDVLDRPYHIAILPGTFQPSQGKGHAPAFAAQQSLVSAARPPCRCPHPPAPRPPATAVPSWLRNKRGSYENPIIIEGLGPANSVIFRTYLNIENVR